MSDANRSSLLRRLAQLAGRGSAAPAPSPPEPQDSRFDPLNEPSTPGVEADPQSPQARRAVAERRRRNDTVRRDELDSLRRIRREGRGPLTAAGPLAAAPDPAQLAASQAMRDRINAIERQMVGGRSDAVAPLPQRGSVAPASGAHTPARSATPARGAVPPNAPPAAITAAAMAATEPLSLDDALSFAPTPPAATPRRAAQAAGANTSTHATPTARALPADTGATTNLAPDLDPLGDDAAIAFASGDAAAAQAMLVAALAPGEPRADDAELWLLLADLYRATGQHTAFDALAGTYAETFTALPPAWVDLRALAGNAADQAHAAPSAAPPHGEAWVCPATFDAADLTGWPLGGSADWRRLVTCTTAGATALNQRLTADAAADTPPGTWQGSAALLAATAVATPQHRTAHALAHLAALRLLAREAQFDEAALEYAVRWGISPPTYQAPCHAVADVTDVAYAGDAPSPQGQPAAAAADLAPAPQGGDQPVAHLTLPAELLGDARAVLQRLTEQGGSAGHWRISCAALVRLDFAAATEVLNWASQQHARGRYLHFAEAHRLVARLLRTLGVAQHAAISLRA